MLSSFPAQRGAASTRLVGYGPVWVYGLLGLVPFLCSLSLFSQCVCLLSSGSSDSVVRLSAIPPPSIWRWWWSLCGDHYPPGCSRSPRLVLRAWVWGELSAPCGRLFRSIFHGRSSPAPLGAAGVDRVLSFRSVLRLKRILWYHPPLYLVRFSPSQAVHAHPRASE